MGRMPVQTGQRAASDAAAIRDVGEAVVRQEFQDETDINKLIRRYGGIPPFRQRPMIAEVDTDMTLSAAYESVRQARESFSRLPLDIRERYATWEQVFEAADKGEVRLRNGRPELVVERDAPSVDEAPVSEPQKGV